MVFFSRFSCYFIDLLLVGYWFIVFDGVGYVLMFEVLGCIIELIISFIEECCLYVWVS